MTGLRLVISGLLVGALTAGVLACGGGSRSSAAAPHTTSAPAQTGVRTTAVDTAGTGGTSVAKPRPKHAPIVQRLSTQQLAGQRIIYSYAGLKPPASLLSAIRAGEAGGVIFFAPNV
ncbi:MAG: hypothetical protein ACXVSL_07230, partial [Solirubrobacteraceae bacterium]